MIFIVIHIYVISIMVWQPHVCTYHTTHNIHHLTPPPSCQPLRTSHHINPYRPQPSSIHNLPFPVHNSHHATLPFLRTQFFLPPSSPWTWLHRISTSPMEKRRSGLHCLMFLPNRDSNLSAGKVISGLWRNRRLQMLADEKNVVATIMTCS